MAKSIAALLLLAMLPAPAHGAAGVPARLLRLEQTWLRAARARDVPVLRRILAADYVDIDYQGAVRTRADALRAANVKRKDATQRLSDERVRVFGDTAVVTGRGVLATRAGAAIAAWRFTDVFVRRDGAWRAVSSQETLERTH